MFPVRLIFLYIFAYLRISLLVFVAKNRSCGLHHRSRRHYGCVCLLGRVQPAWISPARVGKGRPSDYSTPFVSLFFTTGSGPSRIVFVCLDGLPMIPITSQPPVWEGVCLPAHLGQAYKQAHDSTNEAIQQSMQ